MLPPSSVVLRSRNKTGTMSFRSCSKLQKVKTREHSAPRAKLGGVKSRYSPSSASYSLAQVPDIKYGMQSVCTRRDYIEREMARSYNKALSRNHDIKGRDRLQLSIRNTSWNIGIKENED